MKTSHAALASIALLVLTSTTYAQEPAATPTGKAVASIDPKSRPDPRDDAAAPSQLTPAVSPAPAAPNADVAERRHEGVLGRHRLGALASAGFPSIVTGQLVYKYADWVGLTASYGATPSLSLPIADGVRIEQHGFSGTGRVYPFRGAFFLGVGAGMSTFRSEQSAASGGYAARASMSTNTTYAMGELGFLHRFAFGLALGADLGIQIPMSSHATSAASVNGEAAPVPQEIRDTMTFLSSKPIPVLNFLRLGWVL